LIEIEMDLFGIHVDTDFIPLVVSDTTLLSIRIGVYGDSGSGKPSIMKILERDLNEDRE